MNNGEVQIQLGGKSRKLIFSMWALEKNEELQSNEVPEHRRLTAAATSLIYSGLANAYRLQKPEDEQNDITDEELEEIGITWPRVNTWVYEIYDNLNGSAIVQRVNDCYVNCNAYKSLTAKRADKEDEAKKKEQEQEPQPKLTQQPNGTRSTASPLVR